MINLTIPKMACDGCAKSIKKVVLDIDAQAQVEADPATKKCRSTAVLMKVFSVPHSVQQGTQQIQLKKGLLIAG